MLSSLDLHLVISCPPISLLPFSHLGFLWLDTVASFQRSLSSRRHQPGPLSWQWQSLTHRSWPDSFSWCSLLCAEGLAWLLPELNRLHLALLGLGITSYSPPWCLCYKCPSDVSYFLSPQPLGILIRHMGQRRAVDTSRTPRGMSATL